jgi:phenylalanine-4-hydroxylase
MADRGELFIQQEYERYTPANHLTWERLYRRIQPRWEGYANQRFLDGVAKLNLDTTRVPRLDHVNRFLEPLTGFRATAVSGYVPAYIFFECLRRREFPTTVTVRPMESLDYLPEPDIFHDICGHVPMHTDPAFAAALVRFGECARSAAETVADRARLKNIVKAMARFYWFSIEFGLVRERRALKAAGSGLLSSFGELDHAVQSPDVERVPLAIERAIHTPFDIDHYQPLLMVMESFDQLYELTGTLEQWMLAGKLDHAAPGAPEIEDADLPGKGSSSVDAVLEGVPGGGTATLIGVV